MASSMSKTSIFFVIIFFCVPCLEYRKVLISMENMKAPNFLAHNLFVSASFPSGQCSKLVKDQRWNSMHDVADTRRTLESSPSPGIGHSMHDIADTRRTLESSPSPGIGHSMHDVADTRRTLESSPSPGIGHSMHDVADTRRTLESHYKKSTSFDCPNRTSLANSCSDYTSKFSSCVGLSTAPTPAHTDPVAGPSAVHTSAHSTLDAGPLAVHTPAHTAHVAGPPAATITATSSPSMASAPTSPNKHHMVTRAKNNIHNPVQKLNIHTQIRSSADFELTTAA
ncbi:hypothetical protein LWI29_035060 [Acer saccharum]|uniref:Uncharacterized protein n=1 Tax=Acer saccharum TaxID=4024 RepID=A0AA39VY89_ACESA|nr:hypothetical protein LWI29_035060 [Acer saccharum]